MSVLDEICARKREHVAERQKSLPLDAVRAAAAAMPAPRGFMRALRDSESPALIAEVKKASPSKGVIRDDFDPAAIARIYEGAGAACLSVLTDTPYFMGEDDHFKAVRAAVALPMLRKDFMVDPYQIYESRMLGADCVLLIMAVLSDAEASEMMALAGRLGMDVLTEVHDRAELLRAVALGASMIGVNNRSLKTLAVDVATSFDLAGDIPDTALRVAESGLSDFETIRDLQKSGFQAFLVGESLMRSADIGAAVKKLLGRT